MRRLLTGFMVAVVTAAIPAIVWASNQEVADQVANALRYSGRMSDYQVGVKFQNGTAWLRGRVASDEQMETAIRLAFQVKAVDRVVNELTVQQRQSDAAKGYNNPLRDRDAAPAAPPRRYTAQHPEAAPQGSRDERVPSSYVQTAAQRTSAEDVQDNPMPQRPRSNVAMQPNVRGPSAPTGEPLPMYRPDASQAGPSPARHDQPCLPNYAWPSYAAYPNYAAVTYPKQYSPTAWPYIGPFYPYPQVPLGWRKVTLEWSDGWWFLDFKDQPASCWKR